jgi:hypothetical protein
MSTQRRTDKQDKVENIISRVFFVASIAAIITLKCILDPA